MRNPSRRGPDSTLRPHKKVGAKNVLLTEPEYQCYQQVKKIQRRQLIQDLIAPEHLAWIQRLSWARSGLGLVLQLIIFIPLLPFIIVWGLLGYLFSVVKFPFLWISTFRTPSNLSAPGEKNLVGMHNALGRYLSVSVDNYIDCVDCWIRYLYGSEKAVKQNFRQTLSPILIDTLNITLETKMDDAVVRRYLAQAREQLSKKLGHYSDHKSADSERNS